MARSEHARAAAEIRKALKKHGIKARVTSKGYSMGSSVNVTIYNATPETYTSIVEFCDKYSDGNFNGMEDIYEYRPDNGLPRAKYVFVTNEISDDLFAKAWAFLRKHMAGYENAPVDAADAYMWHDGFEWGNTRAHRLISGSLDHLSKKFWRNNKPRIAA